MKDLRCTLRLLSAARQPERMHFFVKRLWLRGPSFCATLTLVPLRRPQPFSCLSPKMPLRSALSIFPLMFTHMI